MSRRMLRTVIAALTGAACLALVQPLVTAPAASSGGDPAYGEYLSSACVTCHRLDGANKGIPSIVGWPADQFIAVLNSYRTKERDNQVMQTI